MKRLAVLLLLTSVCAMSCNRAEQPADPNAPAPIGNAERGKLLAAQYGCNVCHILPGVDGPQGALGPSLAGVASRPTISNGIVQNTPANLVQYIQQPASLNPASTMPPLGVQGNDAQDIAAYLLTLK